MKCIFLVHLLGWWLLLSGSSRLRAQSLAFSRILPSQATAWSGWITGITQDRQGYLWFTTSFGLYRYDGYQVRAYLHDLANPNSVSAGVLETVYADREGILWIGTQSNGLDRLDPETGTFTHYTHRPRDTTSLSHNFVAAILEDGQGILWVGTHGGLNRLDRKTGTFTRYLYNPRDSATLSNDQVRSLYEDRRGTLWIGTGSPFIGESPEGAGGLNRLDRKTGRFTRYLHNSQDPHSLVNNQVRAILEDSRGTFWVGTGGDGLHTMDRQRGTFRRYPYDPAHPERLSRPYLQVGKLDATLPGTRESGVSFIKEANGDIWIGSYYGGLNRYNPNTGQVTHFEGDPNQLDGLLDRAMWSAHVTRDGVLFLGSCWSNLYRVNPAPLRLVQHPRLSGVLRRAVNTLYEDSAGRLWMGGSLLGLLLQDRKKGRQPFPPLPAELAPLENESIRTLYPDRQGALWIGTGKGLYCYASGTRRLIHYRHQPNRAASIGSDGVGAVHEDRGETCG